MRQVLIDIPLNLLHAGWHIPIYGYGLMLFMAYLLCTTLGRILSRKQGIDERIIPDLTIWLFVGGIVGGRIVYAVEYNDLFKDPWQLVRLWDGGLVLYGSLSGGAIAYFAYDYFVLRKLNVSKWKMLDVIAPCVVLGIALGRIGCLCTGCCYGNIACENCPALHFPLDSPAAKDMTERGYQTPQGFLFKGRSLQVGMVEPGSPAARAGLEVGDTIIEVNGQPARGDESAFRPGQEQLTVIRGHERVNLPPFEPTSIGVHPTQIYETTSMLLLLFFLLSYYPFLRYRGELMVFMMIGYGVHRFLNEMLRTDNEVVAFGMTLSQNVSIVLVAAGIVLAFFVYRRPRIADEPTSAVPVENSPALPSHGVHAV